ncbi:MAG: LPS export ABC transporter permease LptG [Betaproteobacteria bacterium]
MKTLPRYLRRELVAATAFVLFALLAIFLFFDLLRQVDEVGRGGYTLRAALLFVLLQQPTRIYELMPLAALLGTIYVLAKLAASSEFTIMRVSGMGTLRLALWVVGTGLLFVAFTYLVGEVVAPRAEQLAQRARLLATGATVEREFRSGVWARDAQRDAAGDLERLRFVNVREVRADGSGLDWRIYEFDRRNRLRSIASAAEGRFFDGPDGRYWLLTQVVETVFPPVVSEGAGSTLPQTSVLREAERRWASDLTPDILGVLLVKPERMALGGLAEYIRHLAENRQSAERYEIAFWSKLLYPLAILAMMMLALPFAYLHVRQGGMSLKVFSGMLIGVVYYMLTKLAAHVALLNTWPPVVAAAAPTLLALALAVGALYWIERR